MLYFKTLFTLFFLTVAFQSHSQKILDLSYHNLHSIPTELKGNLELEELNLSGNPLKSLPTWLESIKSLKKIVLNDVSTLPVSKSFEVLSSCKELKHLSWENGMLVYIPASISKFPHLEILNLKENGIVKIPIIKKRVGIVELDLSNNLIDSLGQSILYFKHLQVLNFSNNPGVNNENNYHLLENLSGLNTLIVNGISNFSIKLCKLKQLESLDVSNSKISKLPKNFKDLNQLKKLNIFHCQGLDFPEVIEKLSELSQLEQLTIGGQEIKRIPFNIFKLRTLKKLHIRHSCLEYIAASIKRLHIINLTLENCSLIEDSKFFDNAAQISSLKKLSISNLSCRNFNLERFSKLDSLDISNCELTTIPISLKSIPWINLEGNSVPEEILNAFKGELIRSDKYTKIKFNKRIKHNSSHVSGYSFRKTIYTLIGEKFTVKGVQINIPPNAFIDKHSKIIDDEVIVSVNFIDKPNQLAMLDKSFSDIENNLINPSMIIELKAYRQKTNDSLTNEEVFINQNQVISLSINSDKKNSMQGYYYSERKKSWSPLQIKSELCQENQKLNTSKSFKSKVYSKLKEYPTPSFNVRNSKVQIQLKRNKRRNTLKFEISPEYGYKENFFQLFGNRIKGYPELKVFKNIKWKYVGDSVEQVLEQLYFLSEQAKSEKLKRKSNFYFYVLDIKNITIEPHKTADNYIMNIVQGKDTLSIEVLPNLLGMKAKKIQNWHKKKYAKYQKKLQERLLYWLELDSLHLNYYSSFEKKLSKFRLKVIDNDDTMKSAKPITSDSKYQLTLTSHITGLYQFGTPLRLKNIKTTSLNLQISGRNHYAKYVLVSDPKNQQSYWQGIKHVSVNEGSENFIYSKSGNTLYWGVYSGNKTIQLTKFEPR